MNSFSLKKRYWEDQVRGFLPAGYRRVEYLESSGAQWIDTGVVPDTDTETRLSFLLPNDQPSSLTIFGGTDASGNTAATYAILRKERNATDYNFRVNYSDTVTCQITRGNRHTVVMNELGSRNVTLDGVTVGTFTESISVWFPIYIFARNSSGEASLEYSSKVVVYAMSIINSTATRNYVPCVRESDSKPGLYDLCGSICPLTNSPFYINAGTGTDFAWKEFPAEAYGVLYDPSSDSPSCQRVELRKGGHYWLEYVGNDNYIGRSDNILNERIHIAPDELFNNFTE